MSDDDFLAWLEKSNEQWKKDNDARIKAHQEAQKEKERVASNMKGAARRKRLADEKLQKRKVTQGTPITG